MTAIREARPDDRLGILRVIEGALLETDPKRVEAAIDRGEALIAHEDGRVLGALVLDGSRIEAVAVRHSRRGRGIGSALVRAAGDRGPLTAAFRPEAGPFYESLGFEIEPREGDDRLCGRLYQES